MLPYDFRPKRSVVRVVKPTKKPYLMLKLRPKQPPVPLWLPERPFRPPGGPPIQLIKLSDMVVMMTLFLAILACTFSAYTYGQTAAFGANLATVRQNSRPVSRPTRLPTLTPTLMPGQLAATPAPPLPANAHPLPGNGAAPLLSAGLPSAQAGGGTLGELPAASIDNSSGEVTLPASNSGGATLPTPGSDINTGGTLPAAPESQPSNNTPVPTLPSGASAPTATVAPSPPPATPVITPTTAPETGWSFTSVRVYGQEDGLLLYGELTNGTGAAQELEDVSGVFYDAQGQLIADKDSTFDYWPIKLVPPGGAIPFELTVLAGQGAADYDLTVDAQPSGENARQDFEFKDVEQRSEDGNYCLTGKLRNSGDELHDYLVIAAVLYDAQGNVVNFDYYDEYNPAGVRGENTSPFDICVPPPNQDVANYELRAWGQ